MKKLLLAVLAMGTLATGGLVIKKKTHDNKPVSNWQWQDNWGVQITPPVEKPKEIEQPKAEPLLIVGSYKEALQKSAELKKPVLVYFAADWCQWCQKMKSEVLDLPEVKEAMKGYVVVFVNVDRNRDIAKKFRVTTLPSYLITNQKEEKVKFSSGYKNAQDFINWLK